VGLFAADVLVFPKYHIHVLKLLDVLVKFTISGAHPIVLFDVNDDDGVCANENLCSIDR